MTLNARRSFFPPAIRHSNWLRTLAILFALTAVILWVTWPLLAGWMIRGHDGEFHLVRLFELDRAVRAGVFYPRLAPDLAMGFGYPVFNYYAPLASYIGEIGRIAGLSYVYANNSVYVFALIMGAWGMFFLLRGRFGILAGAAGAAAYAVSPYQITDVFIRAAQAETVALGLLPWVLVVFGRLAKMPNIRPAIAASLVLALLILAHNITALFSLPLIAGYYVLVSWENRQTRRVRAHALCFSLAMLLGVGLTAFFWLPAILEQDLVQIPKMVVGFYELARHFSDFRGIVQGTLDYDYTKAFRPGLVQMFLAAAGLAAGLRLRPSRGRVAFFGFVTIAMLWLQTQGSQFLWDATPVGKYIQFPWRMMVFTTLAAAWLTGGLVGSIHSVLPASKAWVIGGTRLGVTCVVIGAIIFSSRMDHPIGMGTNEDYRVSAPTIMRSELYRNLVAVTTGGEYMPASLTADPFKHVAGLLPQFGGESFSDAEVRVIQASPFEATFSVHAEQPTRLILDRFYFPGWIAETGGGSLAVGPSEPLGLLSFTVPAGINSVRVRFGDTPVRSIGTLLSLLTFSGLIVLAHYDRRRSWWRRLQQTLRLPGLANLLLVVWLLGFGAEFATLRSIGRVETAITGASSAQLSAHAVFNDEVELAGALVDSGHAEQPGVVGIILYWHVLRAPQRDYQVHLALLDGNGTVVGERTKRPMFGLRRSVSWEPGMIVRDYQQLRLAPGVRTGSYALTLSLVDEQTGKPLQVDANADSGVLVSGSREVPGAAESNQVLLGDLRMPVSQQEVVPTVDNPMDANFADKINLRGFSLVSLSADASRSRNANPSYLLAAQSGEALRLKVSLETLKDLDEDYSIFNHLLDAWKQMVSQEDDQPARGNRPTSLWYPGDTYAEPFEITIPDGIAPGKYALVTGFYNRDDMKPLTLGGTGDSSATLGYIKVRPTSTPTSYKPIAGGPLVFGEVGGLVGTRVLPGKDGRLNMSLLWSSQSITPEDYTVFVHVTDLFGNLIAQDDNMPAFGGYPTSFWDSGDVIEDTHEVVLPSSAGCETYRVEIGMYLLRTGQRLLLPDGRDSAVVGMNDASC